MSFNLFDIGSWFGGDDKQQQAPVYDPMAHEH